MSGAVTEPRPIAPGLFQIDDGVPRLRAAACEACSRLHFPRTDSCPYCGSGTCRERLVGDAATLYLHTAIATRPPGYRGALPYGFGVVELPEGLRVITRLTEADPTKLRPGQPMRLVVDTVHDEDGTPVVSYAYAPADG